MGQYSKKIYSEDDLKKRVTIRILPEKLQVYPRFRDLVKSLGSDVCFVTTSLWEAFLLAMEQNPPVDDQLEIKFLRQNVQINIGCSIFYQPKKARRTPGTVKRFPKMELRKNMFLPLVLDEWQTLSEKQKEMLRNQLRDEGIIEPLPSVSTGIIKATAKKIWKSMENSMTNVTGWLRRRFRRK